MRAGQNGYNRVADVSMVVAEHDQHNKTNQNRGKGAQVISVYLSVPFPAAVAEAVGGILEHDFISLLDVDLMTGV